MSSTTATPVARTPRPGLGPVLELQHVTRVHGDGAQQVRALFDLSLTVLPGELVAVMGPSGSGKSTLLALAGALDLPTDGTVVIEGQVLDDLSQAELAAIRRRHVGYVFQDFNLLPALTAAENVALPRELDGVSTRSARQNALTALREVGIEDLADRFPDDMSGGQQQRVAIARAIVGRPAVLMADEPTGNLDTARSCEIMELLTRFNRDDGVTIVMVTHEADMAQYARRLIHFRDGRIASDAAPPRSA